mgnify:FL=1|tara:strand:+ start:488 stop:769 length:282 start_codon:yes stop_codon:yes gene_type:complete
MTSKKEKESSVTALSELLRQGLLKKSELSAKQLRLLKILETNAEVDNATPTDEPQTVPRRKVRHLRELPPDDPVFKRGVFFGVTRIQRPESDA